MCYAGCSAAARHCTTDPHPNVRAPSQGCVLRTVRESSGKAGCSSAFAESTNPPRGQLARPAERRAGREESRAGGEQRARPRPKVAGRHREGLSAGRGLLLRGPARPGSSRPRAAVSLPLPAAHPRPLRRQEAAPVPCRGPSSSVAPGRRHPTSAFPQRQPRCLWRPLTAPHHPRPSGLP